MRRWSVLLALWLGFWPLSSAAAVGAADALLAQAGAALSGGQYAAAATLATSGLAQAGLDDLVRARLLVARGLSEQAQGLADEALVDFTRALQIGVLLGEERARALFARGLSLDGAGRLNEAIGDYSAALTFAPGAAYALNNRANVYRRQGQFDLAKRHYAAALDARTPNPQYPYFGLGQIAEAQGDTQTARNFYSRAVTADPGFQLALERLKAMGPPGEGPAVLPADTGVIVLKPPTTSRLPAMPVLLQPPKAAQEAPAPPVRDFAAVPVVITQTGRPRPSAAISAPGRGAPLRPAITENPVAPPAGGSTGLVQLGAWRTEAEARAGWERAVARAGSLLERLEPRIVTADLPGRGRFYRLRVPPPMASRAFCRALEAAGQDCNPVRE